MRAWIPSSQLPKSVLATLSVFCLFVCLFVVVFAVDSCLRRRPLYCTLYHRICCYLLLLDVVIGNGRDIVIVVLVVVVAVEEGEAKEERDFHFMTYMVTDKVFV